MAGRAADRNLVDGGEVWERAGFASYRVRHLSIAAVVVAAAVAGAAAAALAAGSGF